MVYGVIGGEGMGIRPIRTEAEILNRKRALSLEMIRQLHKGLHIPVEILIQPYRTVRRAA
jgi:hypothetical protein